MFKVINIYYYPSSEKIFVGRLFLQERKIYFEYDNGFIKLGLNLSPYKLPLESGAHCDEDGVFEGLFGLFNDSLPDGWGRLLLDRQLMKKGINPGNLSPLDRLSWVGSDGMGALVYEPEISKDKVKEHDLDKIANEVNEFQESDSDLYVEELLSLGGSSQGARPKVLIKYQGEEWLVKFRAMNDPKDMGNIEYAYALMASEAGLDVPKVRLFPAKKGKGFFGIKRFDRESGKRVHMHTASGLLHADHRIPSLDYEMILRLTSDLTQSVNECEKMFRLCVFNVLCHNKDDHAKNFSFLMDESGKWRLSPVYDLTFSSGPNGEHCTTVMGVGNPSIKDLQKLAATAQIKGDAALKIITEVQEAVQKWDDFAKKAKVSSLSTKVIKSAISEK